MLFSLIGSLWLDTRIHAFPNRGGWYDLSFVIGAAAFFGSAGSVSSHEMEKYYALGYAQGVEEANKREENPNWNR
jgi:hypothetical protein